MECIKNIYNLSKLQTGSDKCQGKFLWTGIQQLEGKRSVTVWLIIKIVKLEGKRKQGQFQLSSMLRNSKYFWHYKTNLNAYLSGNKYRNPWNKYTHLFKCPVPGNAFCLFFPGDSSFPNSMEESGLHAILNFISVER